MRSSRRLINHCCYPNCTAKIITINGEKKVDRKQTCSTITAIDIWTFRLSSTPSRISSLEKRSPTTITSLSSRKKFPVSVVRTRWANL